MKLTKNQKTLAVVATIGVLGGYLYVNRKSWRGISGNYSNADGNDYYNWDCNDLNEMYTGLWNAYQMELDSPNSSAFAGDVTRIITQMHLVYDALMNHKCGQVRNPPPIPNTKGNTDAVNPVINPLGNGSGAPPVIPTTKSPATTTSKARMAYVGKRKPFFKWLFNIK